MITKRTARALKAFEAVQPVMIPLLELFSTVDDVFTEEGAFSEEHIRKSLGRIHRGWKSTRAALDPTFDPKHYEKKPRVGLSVQPASGSRNSSTGRTSTSGKNRKKSEKKEKDPARKSARHARSGGRASGGR